MLARLSGKVNDVVTGLSIIDTKTGKHISRVFVCKIYLRKMTGREIDAYVRTGEPLDRAGGYDIHERGSVFVKKVEGDLFAAIGLPIYDLVSELRKFGVKAFDDR